MSAECPVVWIKLVDPDGAERAARLHSPDLGEHLLLELSTSANQLDRETRLPEAVSKLLESRRLAGAVLLWEFEEDSDGIKARSAPALVPPPPLGLRFEPMPLKDSNPDLLALWRADQFLGIPRPDGKPSRLVRRARIGVACGLVLIAAVLTAKVLNDMGELRLWLGPPVVAVIAVLCYRLTRPLWLEWLVMPGGVVIPCTWPGSATTCRNDDTVLSLSPTHPAWTASLWRKGRLVSSKALTEFETHVLLAAWRAPPVVCRD